MSFKKDLITIAAYAALIAFLIHGVSLKIPAGVAPTIRPYIDAVSPLLAAVLFLHLWIVKVLMRLNVTLGPVAVFFAAYAILFCAYLLSWFVTEIGRSFIRSWGQRGGPSLGDKETWEHCLKAIPLYCIAWWLCPINHRPASNIVYALNLMRFWPITIPLIVAVGLILPAPLSGHYRDVFSKVIANYPYSKS